MQSDKSLKRAHREADHDLRNLFTVVASAAHLLRKDLPVAERDRVLQALDEAAARGSRLTTALLAGHSPPDPGCADINAHIRRLDPLMRTLAGDFARIRIALSLETPFAEVNERALDAAILELVANALSAVAKGGTVTIRTRQFRNHSCLTIADNGRGMSQEQFRDLWAGTISPGEHGTGFGRVRRFLESSEGSLRVRTVEGCGTCILMRFPLARPRTGTTRARHSGRAIARNQAGAHADHRPALPFQQDRTGGR